MSSIYVYPRDFERCVDLLCRKLEQIAGRWGVPDDQCCDLEATLAVLPSAARSHAEAMLNGIQLQAADDYPNGVRSEVRSQLAREVWDSTPVSIAAMAGALKTGPQAVE